MWPKLSCEISELACLRILPTKYSITFSRRNKKEWAWVSPLFDQLLRRTAARLLVRMPLIAAHAWLFACQLRVEKFKKARQRHDRIESGGNKRGLCSG